MQRVIEFLNNLLKDKDTIVIGLSGGPDSMCLLHILSNLNKNINIICAHINHNIREESKDEAKYLEEYCKKNNYIFKTTTFSKKSTDKNYTEAELREKRYEYFEQIIKDNNAKYLFTAHHGDDLIETILMRITRGSDIKGYSGFDTITSKEGYMIIKPLIYVTKDDINIYNEENNIPSFIDKTNTSEKYTRNRYRKNILPFLKKENKNVHLKYLKFSEELQEYYKYVNSIVKEELSKRYKDNILDITDINSLDDLILKNIIKSILDINYPDNLYLVSDKHIDVIKKFILNKRPNISINLPNNIVLKKEYNKVIITNNNTNIEEYNIKLDKTILLSNNHTIEYNIKTDSTSNYCTRLNSKELSLPLYVRTRKQGDKMIIKNMNNSKKIKDIFIDSKLSIDERNTQPVVVDSNDTIIWLPGLKKSKFDKEKKDNYDIILWYN